VGTRKLITISVPPPLLKRAEQIAREENRTKSELLREALRFYVDAREVRKGGMRERAGALIDEIQSRTKSVPPRQVRKLVREAVEAARRGKRRATA
jgi:metal-responsive CopG/Arc/MetJ family transcriptional regulator